MAQSRSAMHAASSFNGSTTGPNSTMGQRAVMLIFLLAPLWLQALLDAYGRNLQADIAPINAEPDMTWLCGQ